MRTTVEMAREAGLHCAVLLYMYGKESALCDSEIEELRRLERFAALVRADEREQCLHAAEVAAAPDLLEALKEIAADYADRFDLDDPSTNPGIKSTIKQARAAIAKATGEIECKS